MGSIKLYKFDSQLQVTQGIKPQEDATTGESLDTGSINSRGK